MIAGKRDMTKTSSQNSMDPMDRLSRNATIITATLMVTTVPTALLFGYFGFTNSLPQLFIPAVMLIATTFFDILPLTLIKQKRTNLAMIIVLVAFLLNVLIVPFFVQGLGIIVAIAIIVVALSISSLALTPNFSIPGIIIALLAGGAAVLLDLSLGENRIQVPQLESYTPIVVASIAIPIFFILFKEFKNFSLQFKVTLGILLSGGMTVITLVVFGLSRANGIVVSLLDKYEASITEQTEAQIVNTVQEEANTANATFQEITSDLQGIVEYRSQLDAHRTGVVNGSYWNAAERLYQFPDGQYGNFEADEASVFIPSGTTATEEMLADINSSIYLDFLAPSFLESHPEVRSLYYTSNLGYIVYYPNIHLAQNATPGFDPKLQEAFTIATPQRNLEQLPRWSKAYQDPLGSGVIVTLSIPVYTQGGVFIGVMSADIPLARIAEMTSGIRLGETDFAFLVDQNGFILSMPEEGYQLFELEPETILAGKSVEQSIFDTDVPIMQFAAQRIRISRSNIFSLRINNVDTYLAVAAMDATDYKLVIFAPANELNREILLSRAEVQNEVNTALRNAGLILVSLLFGAVLVSLWVGQIITNPLKRLTTTVEKIAGGDITARVNINSQDETGILARSFNTMAEKLSDTLLGLEERIAERTEELEQSSQSNAYRAAQFQSIARVSQVISSTQTLDRLLPQITDTISVEFGFYHVGIFLLDVHKEFAVLAAANSEGGRRMLARNHRLRVGGVGIVGYVTRSGRPRVALDVGQDSVYFNNPDLPETHSEIALPLQVGADIIGALDVQSIKTNAFSQEDVSILSALADQVSIAIQNARSYQKSREALAQAELSAAQLGEQQWSQFVSRQPIQGYHFDGVGAKRLDSNSQMAHPNSLAIPLILRGKQIGTLKLSATDPSRGWDDDEIALAQATAERTALAIESARLLQDAQKRANKERTIGQISAKIGSMVNIENILQTTLEELGNTLPGTDVAIQFLPEPPSDGNRSGE